MSLTMYSTPTCLQPFKAFRLTNMVHFCVSILKENLAIITVVGSYTDSIHAFIVCVDTY